MTTVLEEGSIIAIEPFITMKAGKGHVTEGENTEIYSYVGGAIPRGDGARKLLKEIESKYPSNPLRPDGSLRECRSSHFTLPYPSYLG